MATGDLLQCCGIRLLDRFLVLLDVLLGPLVIGEPDGVLQFGVALLDCLKLWEDGLWLRPELVELLLGRRQRSLTRL
jgi:hypothetical protein